MQTVFTVSLKMLLDLYSYEYCHVCLFPQSSSYPTQAIPPIRTCHPHLKNSSLPRYVLTGR